MDILSNINIDMNIILKYPFINYSSRVDKGKYVHISILQHFTVLVIIFLISSC